MKFQILTRIKAEEFIIIPRTGHCSKVFQVAFSESIIKLDISNLQVCDYGWSLQRCRRCSLLQTALITTDEIWHPLKL